MIKDPLAFGQSNAVLTEAGLVERTGDWPTLLPSAIDHRVREPGEEEGELAPRSSHTAFWIPGPIGRRW